ncbi:MAG: acetyl-CoA carboxylase biotin carboxyl carrier protein [Rhizobiaceae bacterium]|nr:acetyl-CoA carboxylase biotin carboxyl carrier protein [Rhizobiaceae bacterium]PCI05461.1 MAG: acetyl-CoA carboxylase, biotin carboxyl carrier protein [Hyphomicrobiales bacterium]
MTDKKSKSGVKTIDTDLVRDLAAILTDTDLTEIEIEQDDLRIRVSRQNPVQAVAAPVQIAATAPVAAAPPSSTPAATPASAEGAVTSPMVGTAYLSPAPGTDAYVKVGDTVKKGDTILIIEAMKTMNQIPSPHSGKVTAILVEDSQPVEYGEALMTIE